MEFVELATSALGFERRLVENGSLGLHDHGAARGVLAEQRALRSAQHLDFLHIEGIEKLRLRARHDEIIDEHGHRRLVVNDDVGVADAAHGKRGGIEAVDLVRGEVRHEQGQIGDRPRRELRDDSRIDGGNRVGGRLQVRLAPLRGDDDFFETGGGASLRGGGGRLGLGRRR